MAESICFILIRSIYTRETI